LNINYIFKIQVIEQILKKTYSILFRFIDNCIFELSTHHDIGIKYGPFNLTKAPVLEIKEKIYITI